MTTIDRLNEAINAATSEESPDLSSLVTWSEETEGIIFGVSDAADSADDKNIAPSTIQTVSVALSVLFLKSVNGDDLKSKNEDIDDLGDLLNGTILKLEEAGSEWSIIDDAGKLECVLTPIFRACKTFLRWYLQIYHAAQPRTPSRSLDPVESWKNLKMFQVYGFVLDRCSATHPIPAQHVSQMFFYTGYNPISGSNQQLDEIYQHLMVEQQLCTRFLRNLMVATTHALTLSLVRNIHNILVSFPKGIEFVNSSSVKVQTNVAEWAPQDASCTYKTAFRLIILWALTSNPAFPGDTDDLRAELIVEILRSLYALRAGRDLVSDNDLCDVVFHLFRLNLDDSKSFNCVKAAIPLLMDAGPTLIDRILENRTTLCLMRVLQHQLNQILEKDGLAAGIADAEVANLTPSMITIHRFCQTSEVFRKQVKDAVFPPSEEKRFAQLVAQEEEKAGQQKNMSPLDAPKGTFRWKLIRLLTWPNSHISHFAGELLWELCDGDKNEFIYRVGMGNGMPVLGRKGLVKHPMFG